MLQPKLYKNPNYIYIPNKQDTCSDLYNCCDCGGENCGCAYCFSCHACESCLSDNINSECELLSEKYLHNNY